MPTTQADIEHNFLLEDYLNSWLTENPATLPEIRSSKAKSLFKIPDEGPDSVKMAVLTVLCQRYAVFPVGTKRKLVKDWAATEAGTMRAMAIHALLLTSSDVDNVIEANLNEAMMQALRPPIQAVKPELPDDVLPGIKAQINENLKEPMDVVEAQKQVREVARLEAAAKVVSKLQDPEQPVGKGRGRGRGRHGRGTKQAAVQEPATDKAASAEPPAPKAAAKAKAKAKAKSAPEAHASPEPSAHAELWETKAPELIEAGIPIPDNYAPRTKSYTLQPNLAPNPTDVENISGIQWAENQIYVLKSMTTYNDAVKINKKNPPGSTISQRKHKGWAKAYELAKIVAGWVPVTRLL
ncbi:unnamed protein product [Symbiodinium microadriaticum]|nr:unnamed protein product [Symbiodinium microadriaticum]